MKTVETQVFEYDELSEDAQANARIWYLGVDDVSADAFNSIVEDAKEVDLIIEGLSSRYNNEGRFASSAPECAEKIMSEHGKHCETYKTAEKYLNADPVAWEGKREVLDREFLYAILEDYRVMFEREVEERESELYVADNIRANGYTFTAAGKRFG